MVLVRAHIKSSRRPSTVSVRLSLLALGSTCSGPTPSESSEERVLHAAVRHAEDCLVHGRHPSLWRQRHCGTLIGYPTL
jgi:hypothetical protein